RRGKKAGETEPLDKLAAAVVTQDGSVLVADEKKKKVYRFDARYQYQGVFGDAKERQVSRIVLDSEGGIVMLDRDEKAVRVWDGTGRALRAIPPRGPGYELRKPADVAVGAFRNAYVADEEGAVLVFSPAGQRPPTVGAQELKKPKAVALEPSGAVLVYDDKQQRILRFK